MALICYTLIAYYKPLLLIKKSSLAYTSSWSVHLSNQGSDIVKIPGLEFKKSSFETFATMGNIPGLQVSTIKTELVGKKVSSHVVNLNVSMLSDSELPAVPYEYIKTEGFEASARYVLLCERNTTNHPAHLPY